MLGVIHAFVAPDAAQRDPKIMGWRTAGLHA